MIANIYGNGRVVFANFLFAPPLVACLWRLIARRQWAWTALFLATCLGMLPIVLVIGELHGSVFKWRTFIWISVPYAVVLGYGFAAGTWHPRWASSVLLASIVATNIFGSVMVYQTVKQPWEMVARELELRIEPGDGVLVCTAYNHKSFFRYWDGPKSDLWGYNSRSTKEVYLMPNLHSNLIERIRHPTGGVLTLPEFMDHYDRVWVVASWHPECREIGKRVVEVPFSNHIWHTMRNYTISEGSLVINLMR